jgi:hypothetical protein
MMCNLGYTIPEFLRIKGSDSLLNDMVTYTYSLKTLIDFSLEESENLFIL